MLVLGLYACKLNVIETWRTGAEKVRIYLVVLNKIIRIQDKKFKYIYLNYKNLLQQVKLIKY